MESTILGDTVCVGVKTLNFDMVLKIGILLFLSLRCYPFDVYILSIFFRVVKNYFYLTFKYFRGMLIPLSLVLSKKKERISAFLVGN